MRYRGFIDISCIIYIVSLIFLLLFIFIYFTYSTLIILTFVYISTYPITLSLFLFLFLFLSLSYSTPPQLEQSLDVKEQMAATLLAHLELIPSTLYEEVLQKHNLEHFDKNTMLDKDTYSSPTASSTSTDPLYDTSSDIFGSTVYSKLEKQVHHLDGHLQSQWTKKASSISSTASGANTTPSLSEHSRFNPYAELVSSIHNTVQIGFTKAHPMDLAKVCSCHIISHNIFVSYIHCYIFVSYLFIFQTLYFIILISDLAIFYPFTDLPHSLSSLFRRNSHSSMRL